MPLWEHLAGNSGGPLAYALNDARLVALKCHWLIQSAGSPGETMLALDDLRRLCRQLPRLCDKVIGIVEDAGGDAGDLRDALYFLTEDVVALKDWAEDAAAKLRTVRELPPSVESATVFGEVTDRIYADYELRRQGVFSAVIQADNAANAVCRVIDRREAAAAVPAPADDLAANDESRHRGKQVNE
jgi:hypothetical protein